MYIEDMNFIFETKFCLKSQKVAKIYIIAENMKHQKFLRLDSKDIQKVAHFPYVKGGGGNQHMFFANNF